MARRYSKDPDSDKRDLRRQMVTAGICGASVGCVYGAVEAVFSSILPWILAPWPDVVQVHWAWTSFLLVFYTVVGFSWGVLGGVTLHWISRDRLAWKTRKVQLFQTWAIFTLASVMMANLKLQHSRLELSEVPPLTVYLLVLAALALGLVRIDWAQRFRFLTNPWTVSALLVGLPWLNSRIDDDRSFLFKAACAGVYILTILAASAGAHGIFHRLQRREASEAGNRGLFWHPALAFSVLLSVIGLSSYADRSLPLLLPETGPAPVNTDRPNIILITLDTVRADHLSVYGYHRDTTPTLRAFANEATLYTQAIAPGDMTLTSHASLFTGLYPTEHGAYTDDSHKVGRPLSPQFHTLPEVLSDEGYVTAAVVANYSYLGPSFSLNQGFHFYDARSHAPFFLEVNQSFLGETVREQLQSLLPRSWYEEVPEYRRAEQINREVFSVIDRMRSVERPFFLFINYMDAHWPYLPPHPFDELYPGKDSKGFTPARRMALVRQVMGLERGIRTDELDHLVSQYDGAIAYLDHHLEQLFNRLRVASVFDNSFIIVTSDHGEHLGERNLVGHCISVYNGLVHVPLLVKWPTSKARRISAPVSLVDIMPTVLDALAIEIPKGISGKKLSNVEDVNTRMYLSESFPFDWGPGNINRIERSIRLGPAKLITSTLEKREFYNLAEDPREEINLYGKHELSATLEEALENWVESRVQPLNSPVKLDSETLQRLKALGYVE